MRKARQRKLRAAFLASTGRLPNKAEVLDFSKVGLGLLAGLRGLFKRKREEAKDDEMLRSRVKHLAESVFLRVEFKPSEWRRLKRSWLRQRRAGLVR
jgi:hypothetical protein